MDICLWHPTRVDRFEKAVPGTSTQPVIVTTDAGRAYLKAINNPEGEHALARDFVGTLLADWFGLRTLAMAVLDHDGIVDLRLDDGRLAEAGPSLATRQEPGKSWSGDPHDLDPVINKEDLTRLVVFDTWIRNRDRCPPNPDRPSNVDNVFLSERGLEGRAVRVMAIDHTHAFATGDLSARLNRIEEVQDEAVYGLFREFFGRLDSRTVVEAADRLREVTPEMVSGTIARLPSAWDVSDKASDA